MTRQAGNDKGHINGPWALIISVLVLFWMTVGLLIFRAVEGGF